MTTVNRQFNPESKFFEKSGVSRVPFKRTFDHFVLFGPGIFNVEGLKELLGYCVYEEEFELAVQVRDELQKRTRERRFGFLKRMWKSAKEKCIAKRFKRK